MIHLRNHSHYSIKRAFGDPEDFILEANKLGMKYLGITEYANDFSWPYYSMAKKELIKKGNNIDLKFLYGIEFFVTNDMTSKGRPNFEDINRGNDSIIFYAKNNDGYRDLLRILSEANLPEHYFSVPRIDYDYISDLDTSNLVCILPIDSSSISKYLMSKNDMAARRLMRLLKGQFGEDLYIEISANVNPHIAMMNRLLLDLAEKFEIECIASCNIHYPKKEDAEVHKVLLADGEKKTFAENNLYSLGSDDNYVRDANSVAQGLRENDLKDSLIEELIDNTHKVAAKCDFDLEISPLALPDVEPILPEEFKGNPVGFFESEIEKGWQELIIPRIDSGEWDEIKSEDIPIYEERRKYEYDMIKNIFTMKDPNHPMKNGFVDYFLIVSDYTKWAKGIFRRIMHDAPIIEVGPARGSVSGSIIGYLTRMSTVDPIPFGLTFERFINPERVSWPDIDLDFDPDNAWWVEKYLIETYGEWHVAHILTYQTMAGKAGFERTAKVLSGNMGKYKDKVKKEFWKSPSELARLIPLEDKYRRQIQDTISNAKLKDQINEEHPDFNPALYEHYKVPSIKKILDTAIKLQGTITSTGSHPGAVIITRDPLYHHTSRVNNGKYPDGSIMLTTSYEKYALEGEANTMKFDILRLRELTIVRDALNFIEESTGVRINLDKINPYDIESNKKILRLMKDGDLDGVFQFSSNLYKQIIEEVLAGIEGRGDDVVAKDLFNIIIALEALGRPGPLEGGMVPTFAAGLANPDSVEKIHPIVDELLAETYGNMLYQEQLMFILRYMGGFSLGGADMVRRGIASGKVELIEEQRPRFIEGVEKVQLESNPNTTTEEMENLIKLANHIFDLMAKWAGYGFNKAHSVGYGFLSLRGAWLKANYKPHFMAALISANAKNEDKVVKYIDEIRARGIKVLPPKINRSTRGFTVHDGDILFGLEAIGGVGIAAIEKIIAGYPYNNFFDFVQKVGNRTIVPPLIKAGYFEEDKRFLLKYWNVFIEIKEAKSKLEEALFDFIEENGINESTYERLSKMLENIIYQKSLKKRTEKTKAECLALINNESYTDIELLQLEKDTIGMFLSENPLTQFEDIIHNTVTQKDFKKYTMKDEIFIVGMVLETPPVRLDKNRNEMCFLKIQMFDGLQECVVFHGSYKKYKDVLIEGNIIIMKGKKGRGGGFTVDRAANLEEKQEEFRQFFGIGEKKDAI